MPFCLMTPPVRHRPPAWLRLAPTRLAAARTPAEPVPLPTPEVEHLAARVADRLRAAGVVLPEGEMAALAEGLLGDALHLALRWLEPGEEPAAAG